ncbi:MULTISPECIES: hypothetical protein [Bifidobacterium]|nr:MULTISPECIES: hypothetical protein [Bifidobacterium]
MAERQQIKSKMRIEMCGEMFAAPQVMQLSPFCINQLEMPF